MNGCGAFCSYCGRCGRKIDERLKQNKPANVAPPGVPLSDVSCKTLKDSERLTQDKDGHVQRDDEEKLFY